MCEEQWLDQLNQCLTQRNCHEKTVGQKVSQATKLSRKKGLCEEQRLEQFNEKCPMQRNCHEKMVCVQSVSLNSLTKSVSCHETVTRRWFACRSLAFVVLSCSGVVVGAPCWNQALLRRSSGSSGLQCLQSCIDAVSTDRVEIYMRFVETDDVATFVAALKAQIS